jgi:putative ABC transport system ATP-binding protein
MQFKLWMGVEMSAGTNPIVEVRDAYFSYRNAAEVVAAVQGVRLGIAKGEVVCLLGASGSGKSTLLNLIAGLDVAEAGDILVDGKSLAGMSADRRTKLRLEQIGMVFQDNNLIAQFSARENVELVLRYQGSDNPAEAARELLGAVGIAELADRLLTDMSGGQRQRVGIARALAGQRSVLLCDEPTGNLDRKNALALFELLQNLARRESVAVLIATHDSEALDFSDRVLRMSDGKLEELSR